MMVMQVREIIKAAGGASRVGREIGRHHATVLGWERVPAEHARQVAELAGVHPHDVRPDVYDPPPEPAERAA